MTPALTPEQLAHEREAYEARKAKREDMRRVRFVWKDDELREIARIEWDLRRTAS